MHTTHSTPATTRRWFTSLAALGTLGGLAALATHATAQTAPAGPPHGRGHGQPPSPEQMARAIDHRISALIKAVDGTPEQKDRLVKLAQSATADMQPLRAQRMAARKKGLELLAGSSIDRNALERLRQEQITLADTMSKRAVQHMADAAEVLTPAQRSKLAEHVQRRGAQGHHGGERGGWGGGMGFGGGWGG
jgi:periplasmic protein CpxP/Spy